MIIKFLTDDNAAVNALKSGEVDVLSPVNATLAKSLDTNTYQVSAADGSDKYVLAFNCANSKLADKRVRQAIRYGINHEEIIASRGNVDYAQMCIRDSPWPCAILPIVGRDEIAAGVTHAGHTKFFD